MATDVARVSFDPARLYRGVVVQQGRISLEAEQNEQRLIEAEERREELLDIVGPAATPDDGYAISGGADFTIGAGTMYVGGLRVELDEDELYSQQRDWLDRGAEVVPTDQAHEHVVLTLLETDVTAVEDPALYEVALGGPDGAARTRLLQRVVRIPTEGDTCAAALAQDLKAWAGEGLTFDPATMALESNSRLLVTWEASAAPPDPCEPSATGGYLGAENQLIRVQVTKVDATAGTYDLVWGYDDASFLYRVTPDASANPVLTLDRSPVDDFHRPRAGQVVQVLRAAAELQSSDGTIEGYVAALGGEVATLAAPYDPDTKTVQYPLPLPAPYTDTNQTKRLYLRVWEERLTGVQAGAPLSLTGTGLQVTITAAVGGLLHVDDFWCIAVRPSTPTTVFPERYLRTPQPPDGPRLWVCPLAVIAWEKESLVVLEDCRHHFKPLVDAATDQCCTVEVRPSDATTGDLQTLIDKAVEGRLPSDRAGRVTICFQPGHYALAKPLVLRKVHSNLTLEACSGAAVIAVEAGQESAFGDGLVILADADNVTIRGLEFVLPQVPASLAKVTGSTGFLNRDAVRTINLQVANRYVSIGIRPVNSAVLEIDNCLFRFSLGEHHSSAVVAQTMPRSVFGVGVFAAGGSWGLRIRHSRFLHHDTVVEAEAAPHYLIGCLLTQTSVPRAADATAARSPGASVLRAVIDDAEIIDNEFHGLTAAVVIDAELGDVRLWDNVIKNSQAGIWLADATAAAQTDFEGKYEYSGADPQALQLVRTAMLAGLLDPILVNVLMLASVYPLPRIPGFDVRNVSHLDAKRITQARKDSSPSNQPAMARIVQRIAAEHPLPPPSANPDGSTPAAPTTDFNAAGAPPADAAQSTSQVLAAWTALRELGQLGRPLSGLRLSLRIERNNVDCSVAAGRPTGPALFVYAPALKAAATGSAMVSLNRLTSRQASITAAVVGPSSATLTGNVVAATAGRALALGVAAVQAVAITGNVVEGGAVLPANRPFPVPLDTWLPLNTVV